MLKPERVLEWEKSGASWGVGVRANYKVSTNMDDLLYYAIITKHDDLT